ncbi:pyridoxamine 5'-phosphate oxidase family protein [Microbispora bryophytorum]|uniref:pyridoxamine 5'-phosphate oxidase family protein n=1 Tax=Microbispora bryophytorum TaxID=1460882 RepID=UPI0033F30AF0
MAKVHPELTPRLMRFVREQHVFFVASSPLSPDGHVNVSPKGLDSFRIIDPLKVAYLDMAGSGSETSAHLLENKRITIMFCSFTRKPLILRLYGHGVSYRPPDLHYGELRPLFPEIPGERQIIEVSILLIRTSCGFGVPLMDLQAERTFLAEWAAKKGEHGLDKYREENNTFSIDGLPNEWP